LQAACNRHLVYTGIVQIFLCLIRKVSGIVIVDETNEMMKRKNIYWLLFPFIFVSCGIRVVNSGTNLTPLSKTQKIDSLLVIGMNDKIKLPDSVILISNLEIIVPPSQDRFDYTRLLSIADKERKYLGGNIMLITGYDVGYQGSHFKSTFTAKIYLLKDPQFSAFKIKADSIKNNQADSLKNTCIVHIKKTSTCSKTSSIHFNDSLVAILSKPGTFQSSRPLVFVFNKEGKLNIGNKEMHITTGKEYYILLYSNKKEKNGCESIKFLPKDLFNTDHIQ
jgi:hypothetical protein